MKIFIAQSIAKVIGATEKKDGYLQGEGFLVVKGIQLDIFPVRAFIEDF